METQKSWFKRLRVKSTREGAAAVLLVAAVLLPLTLMVLKPDGETPPAQTEQAVPEEVASSRKARPRPRPVLPGVVPLANHKNPTSFWRKPDPKRVAAAHKEVATARKLPSKHLVRNAGAGDQHQKLVAINTLWTRGERLQAIAVAKGDPVLEAKITALQQANR